MKRRFARQDKETVAEQQARSDQIADGASECDTADKAVGIRKNQIGERRELSAPPLLARSRDAAGVAAVRSALLRLFNGFTLRRDIPDRAHVELIDTRWIEPLVSEKAVAGYDEKLRPVLARKPLEQAENNYAALLLL